MPYGIENYRSFDFGVCFSAFLYGFTNFIQGHVVMPVISMIFLTDITFLFVNQLKKKTKVFN